ncbi:MAG: hypothetical protein EPO09_17695 [Aquabacterium sp.]|uniref:hypothetical protein n=1 Tax=Aquabacterium sp. TaxID=1872578 RepID=UPI00121B17B9|nr:hypothetical protein [Aquabacterium sp.]TAK88757.1 MAG: hypothetical protein EPO09_17695 [Aquabacterium sp.]
MRLTLSSVVAASLFAASCLPLAAHAASPLFDGSASLSGLSYQLIDLDPNDGIAPSVTFKTDQGLIFATGMRRMVDLSNQSPNNVYQPLDVGSWLLPASTVSVKSTDGLSTASASADGLSTSVRVERQDAQNLPASPFGSDKLALEVWGGAQAGTSLQLPSSTMDADARTMTVDLGSLPNTGYATFQLSAHTAIVFSGHARTSINVDVGNLPWDLSSGGGQTYSVFTANAGIGGAFAAPQTPLQSVYPLDQFYDAQNAAFQFQAQGVSAQWSSVGNVPQSMSEGDVSITLKNQQDVSQDGVVLLSADTVLSVTAPAAVPELSTWAQGLLGLGGLMALMRRRAR